MKESIFLREYNRRLEHNKKFQKEYYKKNKVKLNIKIINYQKENKEYLNRKRRELREIAREFNLCSICFKERDSLKHKLCNLCREKKRIYQNKMKSQAIKQKVGRPS